MKKTYKFILIALVAVACVYTACKKTQVTSTQQSNAAAIAKQIALGLYNTIEGKYGGGAKIPASIAVHKGPRINDINPYCGFTTDTAFNTTAAAHDTTVNNVGHFRVVYGCSNNVVNSFAMLDSISTSYSGALFLNVNKVVQSYSVQILDTTYMHTLMVGGIAVSAHNATLGANSAVTGYNDVTSQYYLSNMHVDFSSGSGSITSGTSSFVTQTTEVDPNNTAGTIASYAGTITFLGNYQATMVLNFNGTTSNYSINLLTGAMTQL